MPINTEPGLDAGSFNPLMIDDEPVEQHTPAAAAAPAAAPVAAPAKAEPGTTTVQPAPAPQAQATTTAPAEPAQATTTQAAEPEPEPESARRERLRQAEIAKFDARRRKYTFAIVAAALVAAWWIKPWTIFTSSGSAAPAPKTAVKEAHPATGIDPIKTDMDTVHAQLGKDGDLTGLTLNGAQVAAAGKNLYAARVIDGQCTVYGVINGKDIVPTADPTGQACAGQIVAVQAELDRADQLTRASTVNDIETALTKAADAAGFYAMSNFDQGQPSLAGLTAADLDGVSIVNNHGDYATLRATSGDTCRVAIVAADGTLGEISPC